MAGKFTDKTHSSGDLCQHLFWRPSGVDFLTLIWQIYARIIRSTSTLSNAIKSSPTVAVFFETRLRPISLGADRLSPPLISTA
jgi:hypothetical protein